MTIGYRGCLLNTRLS